MDIIIMINVVILVSPPRTVNAILETAERTDRRPNVDAHGVNAARGVLIIANGEAPKTITITMVHLLLVLAITTITIIMAHPLTIITTTTITVEVLRAKALRVEALRAEVLRAEVLKAGRAVKITTVERLDQKWRSTSKQTNCKWFCTAPWAS